MHSGNFIKQPQYQPRFPYAALRDQCHVGVIDAVAKHQLQLVVAVTKEFSRLIGFDNKWILHRSIALVFKLQKYNIFFNSTKCVTQNV